MVSEAGRCQVLINSDEPTTIMDGLAKHILDLRVEIKPLAPELSACTVMQGLEFKLGMHKNKYIYITWMFQQTYT